MNIDKTAKNFGCHDVVLLDDKPTPRHLDYLDLLKVSGQKSLKVNAIAEFQSRPLLYIVSGDQIQNNDSHKILDLQRLLANRGERAYLGILNPGELNVYPVNFDRSALAAGSPAKIKKEFPEAPLFFQSIVNGIFTLEGQPDEPDYVFKTIHDLMTESSQSLINTYGLIPLDVLSFLGRALFFRFLCDRKIIRTSELHSVCPQAQSLGDCFFNVKNSVATCRWLDETFNGDLLPFSSDYSTVFRQANEKTNGKLFNHLRAILEGWEHAGREGFQLQLKIDWGDLDFAHIPIGVLSQVYENFSRIWDSEQSQQTSVYYTPKNIARYLVDDAFEGVVDKKKARILDPSCGAGIFLVLAFRKLVAARWEIDGKRPNTKTIQSILYNQLCGFDVSESALRLAALSLYITAIELNDSPRPPKSLKFPKPLKGFVLYNQRKSKEQESQSFVLGSLRPDLSKDFNNCFDMIVGNPPWSRLRGDEEETRKEIKALNAEFTQLTRQVLIDREREDIARTYHNPDNNPDLPFLWKTVQWAKPGGIIALTLPGRIFLKQSVSGTRAFNAILQGIEITGILNGSNLSDTAVWPGMSQPFMLFFARNQAPKVNHHFYFVTPYFEQRLNEKGCIRIDYQSAQAVAVSDVVKNSWLLKTLSMGTVLDVDVLRKIETLEWSSVKSHWKSKGLYSGRGYDLSPKQSVQGDASFMHGLPNFSPPANGEYSVDISLLPTFNRPKAHMPRCKELYTSPLLIVLQSPGALSSSAKSYILHDDTVFSQSYYGFTAHSSGDLLPIALLHLITHSELFRYHVMLTCSRIGAERRTMTKSDLETFPFPVIELLSNRQKQFTLKLSSQLEKSSSKPWKAINEFIFDLYGLDQYDRQVVKDTLEVSEPYKESRDRANGNSKKDERNRFYAELEQFLNPSFDVTNETVVIDEIEIAEQEVHAPWYFFAVSSSSSSECLNHAIQKKLISQISEQANKTGCSRVIIHEKGRLIVGTIAQYRYWTLSRARLCAVDILRHHLDAFPMVRS